jgi:Protein of unknown function (DUF3110)
MRIFVLLFNARTENEGIHTLQIGDRNIVLMFAEEDDATRFALLLEAQDFPPATIEGFDVEEIEEFCAGAGYESMLIDAETLMVPPENNVEQTDWDLDNQKPAVSESLDRDASSAELDRIRQQLERLL